MSPQSRTRGITLAAAAILLLPAFSQTTTTPTTSGGTTSTGTTPNRNGIPTIPPTDGSNTTTNTNTQPRAQQPIRVSGRVMAEDGTPPSGMAVIELVCNGSSHAEGYADAQGYFSFILGQSGEIIGDASESTGGFNRNFPQPTSTGSVGTGTGMGTGTGTGTVGGRGFGTENRFNNCELRARVSGYRSQSVSLLNHTAMDNPDVGTILVHRMGESEEAATVTATTLQAPKSARKALQKGMDLAKKNKTDEAAASFQEAVKLDPNFALAWCALGKLQSDKGQTAEAHQSFETAAKAEPRWPEPLLQLSLLAAHAHNWMELSEVSGHVLRLNSFEYPQAFFFNAVASYNLKHLEVAEKSVRSAEKLDTQHQYPQIEHLLGTILAEHHQYAEAADELRNYLVLAPSAADAPAARRQLAQVEKALQASALARQEPR
jgi:tetratricopeptide (TPR) repeat protein